MQAQGLEELANSEAAAEAAKRAAEAQAANGSTVGSTLSDIVTGTFEAIGVVGEVVLEGLSALSDL
jgi:cytosine/adenosine deaminase-related metal-dependent hydrolase